jgi:hypothetical protein
MNNLTRLFNTQVEHAWDLFCTLLYLHHYLYRSLTLLNQSVFHAQYPEAIELAQRLLLEPQLSDANLANLHLILAHTHDQAVEHAQLALELYRSLYEEMEPTKVKGRKALEKAIEVAEQVLEESIEQEKEDARLEEEAHQQKAKGEAEEGHRAGSVILGEEGTESGDEAAEESDEASDEDYDETGDKAGGKASDKASISL